MEPQDQRHSGQHQMGKRSRNALVGLTVLELGESVASGFAARLLGGYGARVIKIEAQSSGNAGTSLRSNPPFLSAANGMPQISAVHIHLSAGKESVALDLTLEKNRGVLQEIAASADIIVDGSSKAEREEAGFDWAELWKQESARVITLVQPFGASGPKSSRPATELTVLAESGYLSMCGEPDLGPLKPYGYQAHYLAGLHAAIASLSLWRSVRRTGRGGVVDISIQEAAILLTGGAVAWSQTTGASYPPVGSRGAHSMARGFYPGNVITCLDGAVYLNTGHNQEALAILVDEPRLAAPEFWHNAASKADEIDAICGQWSKALTRAEACAAGQELRVGVAPVYSPRETLTSEQLGARGFFQTGRAKQRPRAPVQLGPPARMSKAGWSLGRSPNFGEHTSRVTKWVKELANSRSNRPNTRFWENEYPNKAPLHGIRVLDVTEYVAGPLASLVLASLGAEVVKVERPYLTDHRQQMYGPVPNPRRGAPDQPWNRVLWFNELARGKKGVVLDLTTEKGLQAFKQLAAVSDIVLDNFSPRVMPNLGLDYGRLRHVNPPIISVSVSGYGESGPWSNWVATGPSIDSVNGMTWLTGYENGHSVRPANFNADIIAGLTAALAALVALEHRDQTGVGQRADVSMLEATLHFIGEVFLATGAGSNTDRCLGNHEPQGEPSGIYECAEKGRYVAISVVNDERWQILAQTMSSELPEILRPDFRTAAGRSVMRKEINEMLATWAKMHVVSEVVTTLEQCNIAYGVVKNVSELLHDPHLISRKMFPIISETQAPDIAYPRFGWLPNEALSVHSVPAPVFGEHNNYVLSGLLGISPPNLEDLYRHSVTRDSPITI